MGDVAFPATSPVGPPRFSLATPPVGLTALHVLVWQRHLSAFHVRTKRPRTPFVSVITRNLERLAAKKQAEQAFLLAEALALEQTQLAAAARLAEIRKRLES